ncbi:MucR family transcriptional regulator [Methylobacterium sp. WL12]|uniref:MucR family transcriptional regulator n=1 Tax=Methylobacterium sp. WL12 TaxID=2603890 RepID=UPI0011CAC75A|nr:MucR family transcriptional regulator [Methylobacterium sp. WL12]TXM66981.1 MucR family transcriptional regulator [Methylobacterium sp. WL12]
MDELEQALPDDNLDMTADIVSAFVSNNNVPVSELPGLIASVHAALAALGKEAPAEPAGPEKLTAGQIRKSITPDALISFEDGKSYKTLRRHLTMRGLTVDGYRAKYGLPADYPMTSASYSAQRSALAHSFGLGQMRRKAVPEGVEAPEAAPKARGRKKVAEPA